jgi:hypothetical protein
MSAARALARAEAAGLRVRLRPDGGLRVEADRPPPPEVLHELRQWRAQIAALLAGWRAQRARATVPEHADTDAAALAALDPDLAEELAAMREHYSAPPSDRPYRPDHPDPLRDGLLAGFRLRPPPPGYDIEERQT